MPDDKRSFGRIESLGDGFAGHLEHHYDHAVAEVWKQLTDPACLPQWLAPGSIELRQGGKVHIDFADSGVIIDSMVTAFDAPRLLEYSWSHGNQPQRPLRWELTADGSGSLLHLTVHVPKDEDPAKACAGFEGHLEMLGAALEGVPIKFPFDLFLAARKAYQTQMVG